MRMRGVIGTAGLAIVASFAAGLAAASELRPEQARQFVVGKVFAFNCFEGTKGAGRIAHDGSVTGTVQLRGDGSVRRAVLPAGTLQVKGEKVCATVKGLPFEPCFNLDQTSHQSFRGSISGFGFAYCDFTHQGRSRDTFRAATRRHVQHGPRPLALRRTLSN